VTIPDERANALFNAKQFLCALLDAKITPKVPKYIRDRAYWCLRHFPSDIQLRGLALIVAADEVPFPLDEAIPRLSYYSQQAIQKPLKKRKRKKK